MHKDIICYADNRRLYTWGIATRRGRHDYHSDEHLINEMLHASYFSTVLTRLEAGDFIYVTDAAGEMCDLVVDGVDEKGLKVWTSILKHIKPVPNTNPGKGEVDTGIVVKYRGPRGGGWCVVNGEGVPVAKDYASREDAERGMAAFLATRATPRTEAAE